MRMRTAIGLSLALVIASATAWAKQAHATHHHTGSGIKAKHAGAAAADIRSAAKRRHAGSEAHAHADRRRAKAKTAAHAGRRRADSEAVADAARRRRGRVPRRIAGLPPPDRYIGPVRVIGRREIGTAAWYGGRHLGERTASGERLDAVHATAAHRSLPLHSLVRVTNLRNGRSAIATINDRGPVSRSLLIDLSPRVAEELDMVRAGIATVAVEPVAATAPPRR